MKILLIHSSAGAGHTKAAEAVYDTIRTNTPHHVDIVDALDYTSPIFKKLYAGSYSFMITHVSFVWGIFFGLTDITWMQPVVGLVRRIYNGLNSAKLEAFLRRENFDYIISAHFLPIEVVSHLKRKGLITSKLIACVTDYDVHHIWLGSGVDYYCVATDWTRRKMKKLGVEDSKVVVTGIPTNSKFSQSKDIVQLKQKLELKPNEFTALIATGSFGIGPIEEIIKTLSGVQIVVICGHNESLSKRLEKYQSDFVQVKGFVNNMHELMAVSDVMITKPGGLSISEALVSQLPLVFFNAIPGQEANNVKVLREYGLGVMCPNVEEILKEFQKLKESKDYFLTLVKKTKLIAHPSAVNDIISLIR